MCVPLQHYSGSKHASRKVASSCFKKQLNTLAQEEAVPITSALSKSLAPGDEGTAETRCAEASSVATETDVARTMNYFTIWKPCK